MSARGVHFAVPLAQGRALVAAKSDRELMSSIEQIEDSWDKPFVVESDKAWDAIHRCWKPPSASISLICQLELWRQPARPGRADLLGGIRWPTHRWL
jgi:hypothetical protein